MQKERAQRYIVILHCFLSSHILLFSRLYVWVSIWSNHLCICKASITLIFSHLQTATSKSLSQAHWSRMLFLSLSLTGSDGFPNFPSSSHSEPPMRILSLFLTHVHFLQLWSKCRSGGCSSSGALINSCCTWRKKKNGLEEKEREWMDFSLCPT